MVNNIRGILEELGYSGIQESQKDLRMTPVYRESSNKTVLAVRKDSGYFIDFAANITGDLADLVKLSLKLTDIKDARVWLEDRNINVRIINEERHQKIKLQKTFNKDCLLRLVKDNEYWNRRGISDQTLEKFEGGLAFKGKLSGRYVFPIFNSKEDLVGFAGRDIFNNPDRVRWKLLGVKNDWVYPAFLNSKKIIQSKSVVLVEGIGDLLSLYECGVENVLSLFGTNLGGGILNFLIKTDVRKIIISTNNDDLNGGSAGNKASQEIYNKLSRFFDLDNIEIRLPDTKKDWGEILVAEGKEKIIESFRK